MLQKRIDSMGKQTLKRVLRRVISAVRADPMQGSIGASIGK